AHDGADHRRAAREGGRRPRRLGDLRVARRRPAAAGPRRAGRPGLLAPGGPGAPGLRSRGPVDRGPDLPRPEGGPALTSDDGVVARIQTPDVLPEDDVERSLRPRKLDEFVGQEAVKSQLAVSLEAAAARDEALDHVLLAGPPGLGKTSLAQIVAAELDVPFVQTAGPALERKGDVAAFLSALEPRSVFFVDE